MIIFCASDKIYDRIIHNGLNEILSNLSANYDSEFLKPENMNQEYCIRRYGELPNVIILMEIFDRAKILRERFKDSKIVTYTLDIHYWDKKGKDLKFNTYINSDYLLGFYNKFKRFYGIEKKIFYMPHVCCTIFRREEINEKAQKKIFFYGASDKHYYFRNEFLQIMKKRYPQFLVEKKHPGYVLDNSEKALLETRRTAEEMNSNFFAFTAGFFPIFEVKETAQDDFYLVAKVFEIMGNGPLLLCNDFKMRKQMEDLGFFRNIHYIHIERENFDSVIKYIMDPANHEALLNIRRNGQKRTLEHFSSQVINRRLDDFLVKLDKGESVEKMIVDSK